MENFFTVVINTIMCALVVWTFVSHFHTSLTIMTGLGDYNLGTIMAPLG
jgi:hypothetical protein